MLIKNGPHCLARAADVPCRGVGPWEAGAPAVAAPWQQSRRRQAWEMLAMVTALAKVVVVTAPAKGPGGSGRGGCTLRCSGTPSCCRPASCSTLRQSRHRRYQLHAIFRKLPLIKIKRKLPLQSPPKRFKQGSFIIKDSTDQKDQEWFMQPHEANWDSTIVYIAPPFVIDPTLL